MGGDPPERWNPPPPSPWAAEAVEEQTPAAGRSVGEAACATEAPASAMVTTTGATAAPPEPSRKRKRGFSSLR
jgi:hypothetical protein